MARIGIFILALGYYVALSAKQYTWLFISSDSGDWLAASTWWMVPQPYGSPLYILLGRALSQLPFDLPLVMTWTLSALPSAVTVLLVYCIVHRLTTSNLIALASSFVLLGSAVFLTQSTILEEYALTTMLVTAGLWSSFKRPYVAALFWGLAASVHVFVLGLIILWLLIAWRDYWKPVLLVTAPIVACFYSVILVLMYLDTPRLYAGSLDYYHLRQYLTTTAGAVLGQLSIFEAPRRLLMTSRLLLMSFGLALVPLVVALRRPISRTVLILLAIVVWTLWYHVTCADYASWTFITYMSPAVAILAGLGLSKLSTTHLQYVMVGALILATCNAYFLSADRLATENPLARSYYDALWALSDNAVVVTTAGSYSMGLTYVISEGKELVPLIYPYMEEWEFDDYYIWLDSNYPNIEKGTFNTIETNLAAGVPVYYADSPGRQSTIRRCFELEDTVRFQLKEIVGLTGLPPEPVVQEVR